jgi:hypothetical protein
MGAPAPVGIGCDHGPERVSPAATDAAVAEGDPRLTGVDPSVEGPMVEPCLTFRHSAP